MLRSGVPPSPIQPGAATVCIIPHRDFSRKRVCIVLQCKREQYSYGFASFA